MRKWSSPCLITIKTPSALESGIFKIQLSRRHVCFVDDNCSNNNGASCACAILQTMPDSANASSWTLQSGVISLRLATNNPLIYSRILIEPFQCATFTARFTCGSETNSRNQCIGEPVVSCSRFMARSFKNTCNYFCEYMYT